MSQTSYANKFTAAVAGMLAESVDGLPQFIETKVTTEAMLAGLWCARDAADGSAKLPAAAGDVTTTGFGFVVRRMAREPISDGATSADYPSGVDVPVMFQGRIWVLTETAAAYGGQVYIRYTSDGGSNTQLGKARNDADSSRAAAAPGCRFATTLSAAGLALVDKYGMTAVGATGATGPTGATGATGP